MRYGVIGTGAIGGYYGAKLAQAGKEVHFLFHSDYDHVARHGLQVESCDGSFHLDHVNAYNSTLQLIKDQMMEVIEAAQACGVTNIDESFAEKMIYNTVHMTPYSPSMKLDFDFHRPMEIHYLYTRPIEEAHKAGYRMRKLEMLEQELRFLSTRL